MNPDIVPDIILIEDNPNDAELAIRALQFNHQSLNILSLADGEEALDYFLSRGAYVDKPVVFPRLVLLDLKLPKVDGFEILRIIRTLPRNEILPVVILSSSAEEVDINQSYKLGANSYIVKPVAFDLFQKTVNEAGKYWIKFNRVPENNL
jgi:two-component system, response regulator